MTPWHPSLYTHWYAVARADQVRSCPLALTVLDTHVALARDERNEWIALEDRCPHRHAPLSAGCASNGRLSCPYHGWSFGADGRLEHIPGLPEAASPPGVRVRAFPVQVHDGFVWLRPSENGLDAPSLQVRSTNQATGRFRWQTCWDAHVVDSMENFLDPMHTHFVHAGLVRRNAARVKSTVRLQETTDGFQVDYAGAAAQSGILYRLFESRRVLERAHFSAPGSARLEYGYANGSRILIDLHFTPRTAAATEVFVALHVEGRWAPAWAVRALAWPLLKRVNDQDAAMLRRQADNLHRFGRRSGASTELDVVRGPLERFWHYGTLPGPADARVVEMMI